MVSILNYLELFYKIYEQILTSLFRQYIYKIYLKTMEFNAYILMSNMTWARISPIVLYGILTLT